MRHQKHLAIVARCASRVARKVVLVGGVGKLERHYRELVEATGRGLVFVERGCPQAVEGVDLVLLVASVCAHNQKEAADALAERTGAKLVALRRPSLAAVRAALEGLS